MAINTTDAAGSVGAMTSVSFSGRPSDKFYCQCLFYGHPQLYSFIEYCVRQPHLFGPVTHWHGNPLEGQKPVGSPIAGLFFNGSPFAVIGGIVLVVINAFYLVLIGRPLPHILKKRLKVVNPSIAHPDPPSAIETVVSCMGIVATRFHGLPYRVFRDGIISHPSPMRFAVPVSLCCYFSIVAPTTLFMTAIKFSLYGFAYISAIAKAIPTITITIFTTGKTKHNQSGVPVACYIFDSCRNRLKIKLCHVASSLSGMILERRRVLPAPYASIILA